MATRDVTIFHEARSRSGASLKYACGAVLLACTVLGLVVVVGALCAPWANATDFALKMLPPSAAHPFGTDQMGRDMLARTLAGLSTSLVVGAVSTFATAMLACVMAVASVFGGRWGDAVVSWVIDVVMGVPHLVVLILISYALGRGFWGVVVGLSLTHWPQLARVLRAELLDIEHEPYMRASASLGVSRCMLVVRHVLPALAPQLVVGALLAFPHAILHEASITFLGFGLPPEQPALGVILAESMGYLTAGAWWLALLPGCALIACVALLAWVGSMLRLRADVRAYRGLQGSAR